MIRQRLPVVLAISFLIGSCFLIPLSAQDKPDLAACMVATEIVIAEYVPSAKENEANRPGIAMDATERFELLQMQGQFEAVTRLELSTPDGPRELLILATARVVD